MEKSEAYKRREAFRARADLAKSNIPRKIEMGYHLETQGDCTSHQNFDNQAHYADSGSSSACVATGGLVGFLFGSLLS